MNVAFVAEDARIDGTIRFIFRQALWLKQRGLSVGLVCGPGPMIEQFRAHGIETLVLRCLARDAGFSAEAPAADSAAFLDFVASLACDAVIATAQRPFPFARRLLPAGTPVYYNILSNDYFAEDTHESRAFVKDAAEKRRIIGHAYEDIAIHASRFGIDAGLVWFRHLPIQRFPEPTSGELARYRRELNIAEGDYTVLTACRLDDDHIAYVRPLVSSIAALRRDRRQVRLIIVGDGTHSERLRREPHDGVSYVGLRSDLDSIYWLANLYVGEGSSRLEAALTGRPVIVTSGQVLPRQADRAFAIQGVHTRGLTAWKSTNVVPATSYCSAISLFLNHNDLAKRVGRYAQLEVEKTHDLDAYMKWLLALLSQRLPDAPARRDDVTADSIVEVDGRDDEELVRVARQIDTESEERTAVRSSHSVEWGRFVGLDPVAWRTLPRASRLRYEPRTQRQRPS